MVVTSLEGVLPVIATPFDDAMKIDVGELRAEVDWLFDNGADGVVVAMVSEIQRLSVDERGMLNDLVCEMVDGRGSMVASVGAESTELAVELARRARQGGASAVMATPPLHVPICDDELHRYVDAIASAARVPLILQDSSAYAGNVIPAQTQGALVDEYGSDRLFLKPEATPIGPTVTAIHRASTSGARIFDGSGGLALVDTHARGIVGTMPGPDLVWAIRGLWDALGRGDRRRAMAISSPLAMLQSMVSGLDAYVAFEKHLLMRQSVFTSVRVRGPVGFVLDDAARALVDALFDEIASAVGSSSGPAEQPPTTAVRVPIE